MPTAIRSLPPAVPLPGSTLLGHAPSLVLSLIPGAVFVLSLALASCSARFVWIASPAAWPWQLWLVALAGSLATTAGVLDWLYHRHAGVAIGRPERRAEMLALGLGGVPLFALMLAASASMAPHVFLVPVLVVLVLTTALVVFDEVAFHRRRCAPVENLLHRALTVGHLVAFLAWAHWVFVRGASVAGGGS